MKKSMIDRAGGLLVRAGLSSAVSEGDLVAVKMHFGEEGNTGFVHPVFVREVVKRIKAAGGKPFLTDANTLYRGSARTRWNTLRARSTTVSATPR